MQYVLTRLTLGTQPTVELPEADFRRIQLAASRNAVFLGLEEKFDLLVCNYEEFELEVLRLPLKQLIHPGQQWSGMAADRMLLARRLVNVLTTSRLYVDQVAVDISALYGGGGQAPVDPSAVLAKEYDTRLGYRVMEALRNHFQHRSLPIHSIYYNAHWNEQHDPSLLRFAVGVKLDLNALRADTSFKAAVLTELDAVHEEAIELVAYTREYMEGLGCAHQAIRVALAADRAEVEAVITDALERWATASDSPVGLIASKRDDAGKTLEKVFIGKYFMERRRELIERNSMLDTLSRRYVTGRRVRAPES